MMGPILGRLAYRPPPHAPPAAPARLAGALRTRSSSAGANRTRVGGGTCVGGAAAPVAPPARVGGGARGAMGAGRSLTFAMALLAEGRAPAGRGLRCGAAGARRATQMPSPRANSPKKKKQKQKQNKNKNKNKNKKRNSRLQSKEITHARARLRESPPRSRY